MCRSNAAYSVHFYIFLYLQSLQFHYLQQERINICFMETFLKLTRTGGKKNSAKKNNSSTSKDSNNIKRTTSTSSATNSSLTSKQLRPESTPMSSVHKDMEDRVNLEFINRGKVSGWTKEIKS